MMIKYFTFNNYFQDIFYSDIYIDTTDDGLFHCHIDTSETTISVTVSQTSHVTCLVAHIATTSLGFPFTQELEIKVLKQRSLEWTSTTFNGITIPFHKLQYILYRTCHTCQLSSDVVESNNSTQFSILNSVPLSSGNNHSAKSTFTT